MQQRKCFLILFDGSGHNIRIRVNHVGIDLLLVVTNNGYPAADQYLSLLHLVPHTDLGNPLAHHHGGDDSGLGRHNVAGCLVLLRDSGQHLVFLDVDEQPCAGNTGRHPGYLGKACAHGGFQILAVNPGL